jgi:hypothetical protein
MIIKAEILKAAIKCGADKGDVRYYLHGFNITKDLIEATNGHVLFQAKHGIKRAKKGIYKITGAIPAKCETVEFVTKKGLEHVICYNIHESIICKLMLERISGKFPDTEKVRSRIYEDSVMDDNTPLLNAEYVKLAGSLFKRKFLGVQFEFRGESKAVVCTYKHGLIDEECGQPVLIIMPMKK